MPSGNAEECQWESPKSTLQQKNNMNHKCNCKISCSHFKGWNKQVKLTLMKILNELVNDI